MLDSSRVPLKKGATYVSGQFLLAPQPTRPLSSPLNHPSTSWNEVQKRRGGIGRAVRIACRARVERLVRTPVIVVIIGRRQGGIRRIRQAPVMGPDGGPVALYGGRRPEIIEALSDPVYVRSVPVQK